MVEKEAENKKRTRGETIRLWVSAAAIPLVVAALGAWQFLLKEVYWPAASPVNLTTEVSARPAGSETSTGLEDSGNLRAIELSITATNVSSRNLYFLSNFWVAYGFSIEARAQNEQDLKQWFQVADKHDDEAERYYHFVGRHFKPTDAEMVMWSHIFPSTYMLYPKETVSRSFVFYVPEGAYDVLDIEIRIPSTSVENAAEMHYKVTEAGTFTTAYRIDKNGLRREVEEDYPIQNEIGLQQTSAWRQISSGHRGRPASSEVDECSPNAPR